MNVSIRPLAVDDIDQVREIEREAFSTTWPQTSFKRELESRQAACLVAWEPWDIGPAPPYPAPESSPDGSASLPSLLVGNLRRMVGRPRRPATGPDHIVGFVGMWFMGPEAHITSIAVREARRGQGIGEFLLMGSIEVAMKRLAEVVSLEARASNHVAHSLYQKYGFVNVGVRKGYYSDNREDAVIMTTEPINTREYRCKFDRLQDAFRQRRGDFKMWVA